MVVNFKSYSIYNTDYELFLNSNRICEIDISKDSTKTIGIEINDGVYEIELSPCRKKVGFFRNILNSIFEALCFVFFFQLFRKENFPNFSEYSPLFCKKKMKINAKTDSEITFDFKSSTVKSEFKQKIYKITPKVTKHSNIEILSNEEFIDFDFNLHIKDFLRYINLYNIIFIPLFILLVLVMHTCLSESNIKSFIVAIVTFAAFLSLYIYLILKAFKILKLYVKLKRNCYKR